jgi:hypothetical protein
MERMIMPFVKRFAILALTAGLLAGCSSSEISPIAFYDQCTPGAPSFLATIECGTANRNAACQANNNCGPNGNAITAYATSLATSIRNRELTETEAQRRWIEFRMDQINAMRQQALQAEAVSALTFPRNCYRTGPYLDCF